MSCGAETKDLNQESIKVELKNLSIWGVKWRKRTDTKIFVRNRKNRGKAIAAELNNYLYQT